MATFMEPMPQNRNYRGENMLIGANNLNKTIKRFVDTTYGIYGRYGRYEDNLDVLKQFNERVENYLRDISHYTFSPRNDNLTKEGILVDLRGNSQLIARLIDETNRRIVESFNSPQRGGRKRKVRKIRKMSSKKMKRSKKMRKATKTNRRK